MKKTILSFLAVVSAAIVLATGVDNFGPPNIVGVNPIQTVSVTITNLIPAVITNTVTFPYPFPQIPVIQYFQTSTNAANFTITNTITTTNITTVSAATNETITFVATVPYQRVQYGTLGLGTFISGAVAYTNTFAPPYGVVPTVLISGGGSLQATNGGGWLTSVTTTNFVLTTGNTNQIFYWFSFGPALNPGANVPTY
jgi:hypothetical protein